MVKRINQVLSADHIGRLECFTLHPYMASLEPRNYCPAVTMIGLGQDIQRLIQTKICIYRCLFFLKISIQEVWRRMTWKIEGHVGGTSD